MTKILTVKMPDIGEGVVEGEVVEWLKNVGDLVKQDEPVVIVMTDKATVELPSPSPGKLAKQYFKPGQIAIKDRPLYDVEVEGEASASTPVEEAAVSDVSSDKGSKKPPCPLKGNKTTTQMTARGKTGLAIPPIRHLAKQLGIDLDVIAGTGKDGRITIEDLKGTQQKNVPEVPVTVAEGDEERPLIGVKRLMAEKMKASKDHIPHFSYFEKVDATRLITLRNKVKEQASEENIHVTFMPFFIRALSQCIAKYPEINSSLDERSNTLIIHKHQNIGVAVAGPQGLVVAVLHDVQNMALDTLIRTYDDLKKRASKGSLQPHETKGSTITISNFGVLGGAGLWATPIINYPEAAILAVDRIQKQPTVKNDEIIVRDVLNVSWSFDHRFIDGEMAAAVSRDFCALVLNPASLL